MQPQSIDETSDDTDLAGLEIAVQEHARKQQPQNKCADIPLTRGKAGRR